MGYWEDRFAKYEGFRTVGQRNWTLEKYYDEIRKFENFIQKKWQGASYEHAMDFGCGIGRWNRLLMRFCDKVKLVDKTDMNICAEMIRDGRIPGDEKFDLIWSCTTLQHVTDDKELAGYLRQFSERGTKHLVIIENIHGNQNRDYIKFRKNYKEIVEPYGWKLTDKDHYAFDKENHLYARFRRSE